MDYDKLLQQVGDYGAIAAALLVSVEPKLRDPAELQCEPAAIMTTRRCHATAAYGKLRHLANWLESLKEDNRAIFAAASKTSQATDY